jgi:hypothetical protein
MMRRPTGSILLATCLLAGVFAAPAPADQSVLGRRFVVSDPLPGDASKRTLRATAREPQSGAALSGDPTLAIGMGGATLEVVANGTTPSWQVFALAGGTAPDGAP